MFGPIHHDRYQLLRLLHRILRSLCSPFAIGLAIGWCRLVDAGEAEAIAVALARGWVVGIEDLFAQRRVTSEAGSDKWVNVATLLVAAVRQGRMRLPEADAIFVRLDCYPGYRKRGVNSLSDLV